MNRRLLATALITGTAISLGGCGAQNDLGSTSSGFAERGNCLTVNAAQVAQIDANGNSGFAFSGTEYGQPPFCYEWVVDFLLPNNPDPIRNPIPSGPFRVGYVTPEVLAASDCDSTSLTATLFGESGHGWDKLGEQSLAGEMISIPGPQKRCNLTLWQTFRFDKAPCSRDEQGRCTPYSKLRLIANQPGNGNPDVGGTNWPMEAVTGAGRN